MRMPMKLRTGSKERGTREKKIGLGTPSGVGTLTMVPNTNVNTIMSAKGWMIAQAPPNSVCLYRTFTSRHTKK